MESRQRDQRGWLRREAVQYEIHGRHLFEMAVKVGVQVALPSEVQNLEEKRQFVADRFVRTHYGLESWEALQRWQIRLLLQLYQFFSLNNCLNHAQSPLISVTAKQGVLAGVDMWNATVKLQHARTNIGRKVREPSEAAELTMKNRKCLWRADTPAKGG